ncbi:hypothetical protein [Sulfurovum mangrovi]|uniref:hypothetical protein n=1 Tax=Sulfurovum mangrovi TaxID=2893889 RepID=UPI001E464D42|nr:hypothetical protein [Sulfurovum mangrovi]UFH58122.1 hypothetical protein LN246_07130 [Sulfurovum mangrovi]
MKISSKEMLEKMSGLFYARSTHYRYNRHPEFSEKYRDGRLAAYDYISELCLYFLEEERSINERFREQIVAQRDKYSTLHDSEYKKASMMP